jgi:hypothetical protein
MIILIAANDSPMTTSPHALLQDLRIKASTIRMRIIFSALSMKRTYLMANMVPLAKSIWGTPPRHMIVHLGKRSLLMIRRTGLSQKIRAEVRRRSAKKRR